MSTAALVFARLSAVLNRIAVALAVVAVLVMIFSAGYQVVARYLFDAPPIWTEELARRAMVWAGMLGASAAFHERSDPTLFPGMLELEGRRGRALELFRAVGVLVFVGPVLYYCLFGPGFNFARGFVGRNLDRQAEMMGVSMAWFTSAVPVAFALIGIHVVAQVAAALAGRPVRPASPQEELPI